MTYTPEFDDPNLDAYASERQRQYLVSYRQNGSMSIVGREFGVTAGTVSNALKAVARKAALAGYAPVAGMVSPVPSPFYVKGTSTLRDAEGNIKMQWQKTAIDEKAREDMLREWVAWLAEDAAGKAPKIPKPAPKQLDSDTLTIYPMGDPHFGLYGWKDEAGEDFDLDEADRRTCAAVDRLIASTPASKQALFINLGDFFHADSNKNMTPEHGNLLDVDTRFAKVAQVGLRAMVYCITQLLVKHEKVTVWNIIGNHDPTAALMLAMCLNAYFRNEKRVEIPVNPSMFSYYKFGKVLIGSHHGHGPKMGNLPLLMAADRPEDWGSSEHRYWYVGHIHHKESKEHPGVIVESFNTLAGSDAWHHGKGYRAKKNMLAITHHKDHGEIERHTCALGMIET